MRVVLMYGGDVVTSIGCRQCGAKLPPPVTKRGRPRAYCSARCRDEAYRERLGSEIRWDEKEFRTPIAPEVLIAETLPAVDALLEGVNAAPPPERLARAVIETRVLAHNFRRLEPDLEPALAWRAGEMAETLDSAVEDLFPVAKETE